MAKIKGIKTKVGDATSAVAKVTADSSGGTPVSSGIVTMLAQGTIPSGWLLCDGAEYDQSTYSGLYSVIGSAYNTHPTLGAASAGKFRVPDFRDMFPMGSGNTMSSRYNLVTYSEQFDNAIWDKFLISVSSNATTDPIGGSAADLITENSSAGAHGINYTSTGITITNGQSYIFSIYIKANGRTVVNIYGDAVAGLLNTSSTKINLSTASVVSLGSATSATVTDVGNGWYRVAMTATATGTKASPGVYLTDGTNQSYTGNGTSGVYLWGAQLVSANDFSQNTYQRIAAAADFATGSNGEYNTSGWNHTHTVPAHTHTLGNHTHTLGNHTHSVAGHSHTLGAHTHGIPSHTHGVAQHIHYFAAHCHSHAISVTASHYHQESLTNTTTTGTALTRCGQSSSTFNLGTGSASSGYTINIGGTAGSSYLADNGFNTDWYSVSDASATLGASGSTSTPSANSSTSAAFNSGTPSAASGAPSSNTTSSDGAAATGSANPPYFGVHFIIKA